MSYFLVAIFLFLGGSWLLGGMFGGIGSLICTLLLVGFVGYQHGAIRELRGRVEELEKHTGLLPDRDFHMSDEEIEEELEKHIEPPDEKNDRT